ncbi:hypothetical protein QBC46DRAFT_398800 [Diplogelasinospora grovesii]|uniref:Zn(2)-C6 fungal-type domain-containing protein n=1 Tax=Diplogelasinospora grovesii TaxID=303347 RepID=A0AAN6RZH2_9PEZI|nr:hypothetical protein QBC46DRAFT_398800 [Diplogelasinospora grovesii]
MQQAERAPRARGNRSTTSCSECRRRKQKCNQDQPCSNCKRRFPEPVCEYGPRNKRNQEVPDGRPNPYFPTFTLTPTPSDRNPTQRRGNGAAYARKAPIPPRSPTSNARRRVRPGPGRVVRWSGVNMTTEYPAIDSDDDESSPWETVRGESSDNIPAAPSRTTSPWTSSTTTVASGSGTSTALILANAAQKTPTPINQHDGHMYHFIGPLDGMTNLPMQATKQNAMLVHTFAKLLCHFKGSFDGEPDPDNPFVRDYVPWCIQSPLLAATSLYISARSLAERQYIDETASMRIKGNAIHTLNNHLRSEAWVTDEALAGVVQFVSIEWFFGERKVVEAHLWGLREMVRLRGGFTKVGVGALVTKVALVDDSVIAMSMETRPILQQGPGFDFDYHEPACQHFKIRFNSPMIPGPSAFASCATELGLHTTTALMLDDIRFLVNTVLNLPAEPTALELKKLQSTAMWIHDRISKLRQDFPDDHHEPTDTSSAPGSPEAEATASRQTTPTPHSLLPQYPSFTSSPSTTASPGSSSSLSPEATTDESPPPNPIDLALKPPTEPLETSSTQAEPTDTTDTTLVPVPTPVVDPLYAAVRIAAPLYAKAIGTRQPFSAVCSSMDALNLLAATWRIPLSHWRGVIGVLLFTLIPIVPVTSSNTDNPYLKPHSGFVKSILQIGFMQMALEDWELCCTTMERVVKLLEWLGFRYQDAADRDGGGEGDKRQRRRGPPEQGVGLGGQDPKSRDVAGGTGSGEL